MKFYNRKRRSPTVIIVALIDIFVILLIFVIATSTFERPQPAVVINLPESSSAKAAPAQSGKTSVVIAISQEGIIFVDGKETAPTLLVDVIREAVATHPLALEADTLAPFGMVIRVMDSLKEAGVTGSLPAFTETRKNHEP